MGLFAARFAKVVMIAASFCLVAARPAWAEPIQLRCLGVSGPPLVFIVDPEAHTAEFVSNFDVPEGVLESTEAAYFITFPATETRWETRVRINRFTGLGEFEFGTPPFFGANPDNVLRFMECEALEPRQLF